MMSIPFARGFAPTRWKQCLEVMLEKASGNPMIHRLRIIVLLEADFNLALRIIWMRRLFPRAEEMGIPSEQWGNRKNRNSIDCASMKLLTNEHLRHERKSAAMMAMDAAACYDRIITALSNICERRHGLPPSACETKSKTLFGMLRHVRTAYGDSEEFYTSVGEDLMHGECQGKTSSPPSWAIYTISLLRALGRFNPGITVSCVENELNVHRIADLFVDDKDMWTEARSGVDEDDELSTLMEDFKKAAQAWERLLFASGGLLALHKCYWWIIAWKWEKGLPIMRSPDDDDDNSDIDDGEFHLRITNGNDPNPREIKRMGPTEANIGLGFRLPPDGSQHAEIQYRTEQSNEFASRVNSSHLSPTEAWVLYESIYKPKIFYPCQLTSFQEADWNDVTRIAVRALLPKMGFNRNTSRDMVFGPRRYGGIGMVHRFAKKGAEGLCHLIQQIRWGRELGIMMVAVLSQLQLLSGRGQGLLENPEPMPTQKP